MLCVSKILKPRSGSNVNAYSVLKWNAYIVKPLTLVRDFWFASIVTSPAQQTKALELDRPELGGMVPSTTHDIPAKCAIPNFSYKIHSRKVNSITYSITLFRENITLLQYCKVELNLPEYLLLHRENNNATLDSLCLWQCPLNTTQWNPWKARWQGSWKHVDGAIHVQIHKHVVKSQQ